MPLISTASIPAGCRAQSEDTSAEIDWLMFERLRSWSLVDRVNATARLLDQCERLDRV